MRQSPRLSIVFPEEVLSDLRALAARECVAVGSVVRSYVVAGLRGDNALTASDLTPLREFQGRQANKSTSTPTNSESETNV